MTIEFSSSLDPDINSTALISESLVDLYVDPVVLEREEYDKQRNISMLNLTWELKKFEARNMVLSVNFSHPNFISPYATQDNLVFHLKRKSSLFFSTEVSKHLDKDSWTLKTKIRK